MHTIVGRRVRAMWVVVALSSILITTSSQAQEPSDIGAAKHVPLPTALRPICSNTTPVAASPAAAQKRTARDFAARAQQAAILGDPNGALAALRAAKASDPTDGEFAFQLARAFETAGFADSAVTEYCRYLALAPSATDGSDARIRIAALARPTTDPRVDSANVHFNHGLDAYARRSMADADAEFSRALREEPAWGDAYYNRALARAALGDRDRATSDLEFYLRLTPAAVDRASVTAWMTDLRFRRFSAAEAFSLGIVLPGAGQLYTRRPGWAVVPFAAAGSAIGFALLPRQTTTTTQQQFVDASGTHTATIVRQQTDRPYMTAGLVAAGAITLIGAIEAEVFARRDNGNEHRVSLMIVPLPRELAARLSIRVRLISLSP